MAAMPQSAAAKDAEPPRWAIAAKGDRRARRRRADSRTTEAGLRAPKPGPRVRDLPSRAPIAAAAAMAARAAAKDRAAADSAGGEPDDSGRRYRMPRPAMDLAIFPETLEKAPSGT
jgi:hypothetical protein